MTVKTSIMLLIFFVSNKYCYFDTLYSFNILTNVFEYRILF